MGCGRRTILQLVSSGDRTDVVDSLYSLCLIERIKDETEILRATEFYGCGASKDDRQLLAVERQVKEMVALVVLVGSHDKHDAFYEEVSKKWGFERGDNMAETKARHRSTEEYKRDLVSQIRELEITANSLVNLCLTGRCPRQFLPMKQALLASAADQAE